MAEFLPKFKPGQTWTAKTSADVTAGQLLIASGDGTVGPSTANSVAAVGVAGFDADSGDVVTVYSGGIAVLTSSGSVSAGDLLVPAASGKVSALAAAASTPTQGDVANGRAVVGVALTTAASNKVTVQFTRW